jgi:hypothetical protein
MQGKQRGCGRMACISRKQKELTGSAKIGMYVNRKTLEEIAGGQERSEERRGTEGTSTEVHISSWQVIYQLQTSI